MVDSKDVYRELLDCITDGVYFTDTDRRIAYWNKGAESLTGFSHADVIGKRCMDSLLIHIDDSGKELCKNGCPLSATLQDGQARDAQVFLHHKSGHRIPVRVRVTPRRDAEGAIIGAVEVFSDHTAYLEIHERLSRMEQLALLDTLTGLANRRYVESAIYSRLEELRRNQWRFGVLFLDIDNFKAVNDTYGHDAGDRVLRMVGQTLNAASRHFDTIGRWGGEEFIAVIANADAQLLHEIGTRLRILVAHSALDDPQSLSVTISVGGAEALVEDTPESLLQRADKKLYEAKHTGKNRVCI